MANRFMAGRISPRSLFSVFLLFFLVWACPSEGKADIYKYVDENGVMHFTNVPNSSRYQLFMKGSSAVTSLYTPSSYDHYISVASNLYNVPSSLIKSVIKVESNFNNHAVSPKGAQGLMQIMPETAKILNISDPFDPWENIRGGTQYLNILLKRFDGKLKLALAGYNAGPLRVEEHNGIPPYKETQNYVRKVIEYYKHFEKKNSSG